MSFGGRSWKDTEGYVRAQGSGAAGRQTRKAQSPLEYGINPDFMTAFDFTSMPDLMPVRTLHSMRVDKFRGKRERKRRAPSAYVLFYREQCEAVKREFPDRAGSFYMNFLAQKWKEMSPAEHNVYIQQSVQIAEELRYDPDYAPPAPGGSRDEYMGNTPPKSSPTGRQVIQNMLSQNIRVDKTWLIQDPDGKIYLQTEYAKTGDGYEKIAIDSPKLHMGHIYDAVKFWNEIGRFTGKKSKCVRDFMMDANNYLIQYGPRNQQLAPHTPYLAPEDNTWGDFAYEPCQSVGDQANFVSMKRKLAAAGYQ